MPELKWEEKDDQNRPKITHNFFQSAQKTAASQAGEANDSKEANDTANATSQEVACASEGATPTCEDDVDFRLKE